MLLSSTLTFYYVPSPEGWFPNHYALRKAGEKMHGTVKEYKMSEAERLAYIAKHPIVVTDDPRAGLSHVTKKQQQKVLEKRKSQPRIIDGVDKERLHRLFMDGEKLEYIAKVLGISLAVLNNYIKEQRRIVPEDWPYRTR